MGRAVAGLEWPVHGRFPSTVERESPFLPVQGRLGAVVGLEE